MRRANTKNKLALSIALAVALTLSFLPNVYASGPEGDSDDRYDNIPGAGDCWQDGYKDGQNSGFNEDRNDECRDKGNQYYEA